MKSLVMKSIYAGLGLLGTGKETVEDLGRALAKRADLSEKDGEKIVRTLRANSAKAVQVMRETLDAEVSKVVNAFHAAAKELTQPSEKKPKSRGAEKRKPRGARAKRRGDVKAAD
jgi:hypothetical protein